MTTWRTRRVGGLVEPVVEGETLIPVKGIYRWGSSRVGESGRVKQIFESNLALVLDNDQVQAVLPCVGHRETDRRSASTRTKPGESSRTEPAAPTVVVIEDVSEPCWRGIGSSGEGPVLDCRENQDRIVRAGV